MTIYFDMDGTIADLYSVENWLADLRAERTTPYSLARPLINLARLARALNNAQRRGYRIGILSWGAKNASTAYDFEVARAKIQWLARHLPSVQFDEIIVLHYGVSKASVAQSGDILFDDEEHNRDEWGIGAYPPSEIFKVIAALL